MSNIACRGSHSVLESMVRLRQCLHAACSIPQARCLCSYSTSSNTNSQAGPSRLAARTTSSTRVHGSPGCSSLPPHTRSYRSFVRIKTPPTGPASSSSSTSSSSGVGGSVAKVPLTTKVFGQTTSRGTRPYQEDTSSVSCVQLPVDELRASLRKGGRISTEAERRWKWDGCEERNAMDLEVAGQVNWFGVYDGHGGDYASTYLARYLHQIFEGVQPDMVTDTVQYTRQHGGYFRRFAGGVLERWVRKEELKAVRAGGAAGGGGSRMGKSAKAMEKEADDERVQAREKGVSAGETKPTSSEQDASPSDSSPRANTMPPPAAASAAAAANPPVHAAVGGANASVNRSGAIITPGSIAASSSSPTWTDDGLTKRIPPPEGMEGETMTLAERATLAFLVADRHVLTRHPQPRGDDPNLGAGAAGVEKRGIQTRESIARKQQQREQERQQREHRQRIDRNAVDEGGPPTAAQSGSNGSDAVGSSPSSQSGSSPSSASSQPQGGSTASVLTLHSLDSPPRIWYSSEFLSLGAWHIGDTRMLLCTSEDGKAIPLTTHHHPDAPSESERLRRLGAGVVTDSFGEARWMGALANTRAVGDGEFKAAGVTSEPECLSQVIRAERYSHVTLFSDGISSVMSDQEVVDLARGCAHPHEAAKKILAFAEELGVEDNATVLVVPLRGWGKIGGEDTTLKQREYRKSKTDVFRANRQ